MAKNKKTKKEEEVLVNLVEAREQAQSFFERNNILITAVVVVPVLLIAGWFLYHNFVKIPQEQEAAEQMYKAEEQFRRDSFSLALANPGSGFPGFLQIISEYGGTKAGNTARYYAGVCYMNLGSYEAARDYLKQYKPSGEIIPPMASGLLGDAYAELNDYANALSQYKKATQQAKNGLTTPYYLLKTGMLLEHQQNPKEALSYYKRIKDEYPESVQARNIDRYIARVEN